MGGIRNWREARRRKLAQALQAKLSEGARNERGAVAIIFAFAVIVLVPLVLGLFDVYTASEQRTRMQDALDAAALYAARSDSVDSAEIDALGKKALAANLKLLRGATLISSHFGLTDNNTKVVATATVQPLALAPAFWAHPPITVGSDVIRNSKNLEVSVVLDATGSMAGSKIEDLKVAAKELVDLVVKEQQAPYYSKVALVPWAAGVNVNTYATQVRGAVVGTKNITALSSWYTGSQKTVSGATRANPVVITASSHGFANGDTVMITGVSGMTQINGVVYKVANKTTNTFQLQTPGGSNVNGSSYNSYSSGGKVSKCVRTDCTMTVTAAAHGYVNNDYVYFGKDNTERVNPATNLGDVLKDNVYQVSGVTTNTFNIFEPKGPTAAYSSGGVVFCTKYGCEYQRFTNSSNNAVKLYRLSTCVSERTGAQKYTDVAPSTASLGYHYPAVAGYDSTTVSYNSPCPSASIKPLSTDKAGLKTAIDGLVAEGTTAGQVGTAWAWYVLSPNFNYLWAGNGAASYTATDTLKVAVIMTDGALNTAYCNGISSSDSLMFPNDRINCAAPNGTTFTQSLALCSAMKAAKVVIYTVGFDISGDQTATDFVEDCASDPSHVYKPETGAALTEAFKAIGADINNLRLSK